MCRGEYNPGVATALVLFLPAAFFYFHRQGRQAGWQPVALAIGAGLLAHLLLRALIAASYNAGETISLWMWIAIASGPLLLNSIWQRVRR